MTMAASRVGVGSELGALCRAYGIAEFKAKMPQRSACMSGAHNARFGLYAHGGNSKTARACAPSLAAAAPLGATHTRYRPAHTRPNTKPPRKPAHARGTSRDHTG